ncbi:3-hydroxyacyl-CoA dehydrogenase NAD-binding domain-containing protein [Lysinibacillus parviboronicapiens]|uniref:3-hydroxyacyl-CoA dehydrogenase NAD-binding domain-containing protein n=1 Tax=Lysinibacillus parviboronicapiens TaxID=436516 RepID=UPI00142D3893|nr:3-hydroxyacyl-CoA dehydrogenase NAD-binding domain-containing protein [Lysinibacillus parviboronicapiens]
MQKILIIGGGFMGSAIAKYFLQYNVTVYLYEPNIERLQQLQQQSDLQKITFLSKLERIEGLTFVFEAIVENLQVKQTLFEQLDSYYGKEITFCTNTSSYLISDIAEKMIYKERLIGTHFFSPAHITPLIEVVPSAYTSQERANATMLFLQSMCKKPILLKREIEGFVANRLQSALAREAMSLVEKGIVTAEELDFIAKMSLGVRLANTGPLEQRDINGLDTHYAIADYVYPTLENGTKPLEIHHAKIDAKQYGMKSNQGFYDWSSIDKQQYLAQKEKTLLDIIKLVQ